MARNKAKPKTKNETKAPVRRKHDPFFRYIYAIPENARTLLRLAQYRNPEIRRMLASVDMQTLEPIPGNYSNVKEWGEADLAFKASLKHGPEIFVGILLEHKSYRRKDVLSQIYRYVFEIMVNKGSSDFGWYPTKAIIIYNGQKDWDPMAEFRAKYRGEFNGHELPFECVLVNLADIPDSKCFAERNVEAAVGALVMKYAFDGEKLKGVVKQIVRMLSKMESDARATLVEKIELYLHEYIDEDVVEELRMRMSIGQALGIVTAGDRRRAAERNGRRAGLRRGKKIGMELGAQKEREKNAAREARIAEYLRSIGVPAEKVDAALAIK
ncbi:Rpn family recombination-promoting nuclease/putative transposase [Fibrobacter sp.]|nr:Rpn family recombination-promoting nuclease/putative transposase [Fibrobacter sp.]MBR4006420.1 Rpn family recombination-promoting nuclease/putative transposase [Fibrobacter sp.]